MVSYSSGQHVGLYIERLAEFVSTASFGEFPPPVQDRVKTIFLDAIACAVVGRHGPDHSALATLAGEIGGGGSSTVIGSQDRLSPIGATLLNAYQVTALTVCDVFRKAHCHVTPQVVPPALAVAERQHSTGAQLLTAVAVGLETTVRIGTAINYPEFRRNGWHSPGVIGPFGGAAAVGSLYRLSPSQVVNALGLAGSQAAGTFAHWGTSTIKFHQARGAVSALLAGMLARDSFTTAPDVFEATDGGLFATYTEAANPNELTEGLGVRWELGEIALRRWPAGSPLQSMITGLFELLIGNDVRWQDIDRIIVRLPTDIYEARIDIGWEDGFKALVSPRYVAGIVAIDRACWLEQFQPDRYEDPSVAAFIDERVSIESDGTIDGTGCHVTIQLKDGEILQDIRSAALGDPEFPLTLSDVSDKFMDASQGIYSRKHAQGLIERLVSIEEEPDVSEVVALLAGG